jgi:hypothetical protein
MHAAPLQYLHDTIVKSIPEVKSVAEPPIGDASLLVSTESGLIIFLDADGRKLTVKPGGLAFFTALAGRNESAQARVGTGGPSILRTECD